MSKWGHWICLAKTRPNVVVPEPEAPRMWMRWMVMDMQALSMGYRAGCLPAFWERILQRLGYGVIVALGARLILLLRFELLK